MSFVLFLLEDYDLDRIIEQGVRCAQTGAITGELIAPVCRSVGGGLGILDLPSSCSSVSRESLAGIEMPAVDIHD